MVLLLLMLSSLFRQIRKPMSKKENEDKESNEPDYDEDKDQLEESQEDETGEKATTNTTF